MNGGDDSSGGDSQGFWTRILRDVARTFGLAFVVGLVLALMGATWAQVFVIVGIIFGWNTFVPHDLFK